MNKEEQLLEELATAMDNPLDVEIDKQWEAKLFEELGSVDGLQEYLRATMGMDIKRYFKASSDSQRDIIRGAYSRTAFLRSAILVQKKKEQLEKK